jgi:hypothetical protein
MTTVSPRRRVLRPLPPASAVDSRQQARIQKRHTQLAKERASLDRWMARLKRAFRAVERQQLRIARLERALAPRATA